MRNLIQNSTVKRGIALARAVVGICICFWATGASARAQTVIDLSPERVKRVYELAFPRASLDFDVSELDYILDVRIDPSFRAAAQLSIVKYRDGRMIVRRLDLGNRDKSLGDQLIELIERSGDAPEEILVKQLNIVESKPKVDSSFARLIDDFFRNQDFRKETRLRLDGIGYRIWYVDAGSNLHFSLTGGERSEKSEPSLITWARKIMDKSFLY